MSKCNVCKKGDLHFMKENYYAGSGVRVVYFVCDRCGYLTVMEAIR